MALALVAAIVPLAAPAQAAPPANDDLTSATAVSAVPFFDKVSPAEATRSPDDPACSGTGRPSGGRSRQR